MDNLSKITLQEFNKKIESLNVSLDDFDNFIKNADNNFNTEQLSSDIQKELFNTYYKLKNQYDSNYQTLKDKILHDDTLSLKQKKQKFLKLKKKCVNCNKDGGTIFTNNNGILKAICGNSSNPCKLNLEIKKQNYMLLLDDNKGIQDVYKDINETKEEIIIEKLNLLFQYTDEQQVLKSFNHLKKELNELLEVKISLLNEINDKINNKEKEIEIKNINLSNQLIIKNIKELLKDFEKSPSIQLIKDIILLYKNNLMKGLKQLNNVKYSIMKMDYDEDTNVYTLIQKKYTMKDLEIII